MAVFRNGRREALWECKRKHFGKRNSMIRLQRHACQPLLCVHAIVQLTQIFSISTPFTQLRNISNKGIRHEDHLDKGIFCSDFFCSDSFLTYFYIPITFGYYEPTKLILLSVVMSCFFTLVTKWLVFPLILITHICNILTAILDIAVSIMFYFLFSFKYMFCNY